MTDKQKFSFEPRILIADDQPDLLKALPATTIAARSGDPFAVQRLLGHADLQMATRYVQDVSAQIDRVIENSRSYICQIK